MLFILTLLLTHSLAPIHANIHTYYFSAQRLTVCHLESESQLMSYTVNLFHYFILPLFAHEVNLLAVSVPLPLSFLCFFNFSAILAVKKLFSLNLQTVEF